MSHGEPTNAVRQEFSASGGERRRFLLKHRYTACWIAYDSGLREPRSCGGGDMRRITLIRVEQVKASSTVLSN
jgi:hypothetical protein